MRPRRLARRARRRLALAVVHAMDARFWDDGLLLELLERDLARAHVEHVRDDLLLLCADGLGLSACTLVRREFSSTWGLHACRNLVVVFY